MHFLLPLYLHHDWINIFHLIIHKLALEAFDIWREKWDGYYFRYIAISPLCKNEHVHMIVYSPRLLDGYSTYIQSERIELA